MKRKTYRPLSSLTAFLVSAFILALAVSCGPAGTSDAPSNAHSGAMHTIRSSKVVRAGWAPYPPYAMRNLKTGKVDGYYPALFERGMREAGLSVEWTEATWTTMISDLKTGRFDVFAAPVFRTPSRALQVSFTREIDWFGLSALVRASDKGKFSRLDDINQKGVRVSVLVGEVGEDFARRRLPNATLIEHTGGNISVALLDVVAGRSDVGITDSLTISQFVHQHPGEVVDLFGGSLNKVGAGWFVGASQTELLDFLNTTVDWLESSGAMEELAAQYGIRPPTEK